MKIEKNIPIPGKMSNFTRHYKTFKWKDLEVNDSILFENAKETNKGISSIISYSKRRKLDWKIIQRKVENGIRIWRIK